MGSKPKIHYFKEFQDNKKRLFILLTLTSSDPLFKENKILKISDFIRYKNTEFVIKCLRQENLSTFNEMFHTINQNHHYNTRAANNYQPDFSPTWTTYYGTYSFIKKAAEAWNEIQNMSTPDLLNCEFTDFKKEILRLCYNKYYS